MKAIIGLGNPGIKYAGTRHNIGFDAVTALSDRYFVSITEKGLKGKLASIVLGGEKVLLVQPQTFMNLSGECVRLVMDYYKIDLSDVIVVCDDINLDTGRLRIRKKGSAGGHNGLKNIILNLGTDEFARIRIGVGEKPEKMDLADYVLSRFPADEEDIIRSALKRTADALETWIEDGIDKAMNLFNKAVM